MSKERGDLPDKDAPNEAPSLYNPALLSPPQMLGCAGRRHPILSPLILLISLYSSGEQKLTAMLLL